MDFDEEIIKYHTFRTQRSIDDQFESQTIPDVINQDFGESKTIICVEDSNFDINIPIDVASPSSDALAESIVIDQPTADSRVAKLENITMINSEDFESEDLNNEEHNMTLSITDECVQNQEEYQTENIQCYIDKSGNMYVISTLSEDTQCDEIASTCSSYEVLKEQDCLDSIYQPMENSNDGDIVNADVVIEEGEDTDTSDYSENNEIDVETLADFVQALKCKECDFTTLCKDTLIAHHEEFHINNSRYSDEENTVERMMYICGQCTEHLPSVQACRQHMMQVHRLQAGPSSSHNTHSSDTQLQINEDKPYLDDKDAKENTLLMQQMRDYWLQIKTTKELRQRLCSDRKIMCTVKRCPFGFNSVSSMNLHRSCHVDSAHFRKSICQRSRLKGPEHSFKCSICNACFESWRRCSQHLRQAHNSSVDLFQCPLCQSVTTHSVAKMAQHLARHKRTSQKTSDCSECNEGSVQQHKTEREDFLPQVLRWYSQKRCDICKKMYANSKSLKKHIQAVHNKIKPFICNVCAHSAASKHMLQLHMRQHTGEKPFTCDFCSYQTGDHNTLRKHRMKHTGERPYKCQHCTYAAIQSHALRNHLCSQHPGEASSTQRACPQHTVPTSTKINP